jgi:hypothetical protein
MADVRTWADGFGVWHARVDKDDDDALGAAQDALCAELVPRYADIDPACWTAAERVPDLDTDTTIVYREGLPT